MATVNDLVDSLVDGDTLQIQDNLNSIMSDKLSAVLDVYKTEVARNMFNPQSETVEAEEEYEEEHEEVEE